MDVDLAIRGAVLGLLGLAFLRLRLVRPGLAGTTLVAPQTWAGAALAFLFLAEAWQLESAPAPNARSWLPLLQFIAAAATFCPTMALLGAKRPQDRGWQWIVGSLWLIVSLPALQAWVFLPDGRIELHAAHGVFLWLLILLGLFNSLPTRFWIAGLLTAAGQIVLFAQHLPLLAAWENAPGPHVGAGLFACGVTFSPLGRALDLAYAGDLSQLADAAWREFRDRFGAFWALRVWARINTDADLCKWPARLTWKGVRTLDGSPGTNDERASITQALGTILRRFVSPNWLNRLLVPLEPGDDA